MLRERGMLIESDSEACRLLEQVNYYRLSGYWYSWRKLLEPEKRADSFIEGTTLDDVAAVYMFDCRLRETVFACLAPIELSVRSMLGHELGHVAPFAHLHPNVLGPLAQASDGEGSSAGYQKWLARYEKELRASREDFVAHHKNKYGGRLPIWAAVEVITNRFLLWTLLDPVQAIREWLRVLRPGGLLFCADANHFPHGITLRSRWTPRAGLTNSPMSTTQTCKVNSRWLWKNRWRPICAVSKKPERRTSRLIQWMASPKSTETVAYPQVTS